MTVIVRRNREKYSGSPRKYDVDANSTDYLNNLRSYFWKLYVFVEKSKPAYKNNIGYCERNEAKMILVSQKWTVRFGIYLSSCTKYDKNDIILYESAPRIIRPLTL